MSPESSLSSYLSSSGRGLTAAPPSLHSARVSLGSVPHLPCDFFRFTLLRSSVPWHWLLCLFVPWAPMPSHNCIYICLLRHQRTGRLTCCGGVPPEALLRRDQALGSWWLFSWVAVPGLAWGPPHRVCRPADIRPVMEESRVSSLYKLNQACTTALIEVCLCE